jgi:hypothetical protein
MLGLDSTTLDALHDNWLGEQFLTEDNREFKAKPFVMKTPFAVKRCVKELTIPTEPSLNTQKRAFVKVDRQSTDRTDDQTKFSFMIGS